MLIFSIFQFLLEIFCCSSFFRVYVFVLAYGFALIWFFFNGSWSFVRIFALCLFWLEIGRESSYLDLASWAEGPEIKG